MEDLNNTEDAGEQVEIIRGCAGLAYAGKLRHSYQNSDVLTGVIY